ncbi:endonuclease/exonuclease/phosphatase family protein [Knoellia locipacati]|nr:endonuclease/exonuclease/phosphatase family protein [Knoellia locipacati]
MTRTQTRHGAALAVATLALTGAIGAATATSAQAAPSSIFVISHNLQKKNSAVDRVAQQAREHPGGEVLLFQEVCAQQVDRIKKLGQAVYRERKAVNKNCGGKGVGEMAVWTGGNRVGTSKHNLGAQQEGGHTYGLACVTFTHSARKTRACSTHLAAGGDRFDPVREATASAIRDKANGWITGDKLRVIVGGDFNSRPGDAAMDYMYADGGSTATGPFRELHQMRTGKPARGGLNTFYKKKIDYIFVSKVDSRSQGGTEHARKITDSDHRVLFGSVPLKSR